MVANVSARTPNPKLSSEFVNKNTSRIDSSNLRKNPKRPPLLPSEAENGPTVQLQRPKSREITSRYLSSSSTSSSSSSNSSNSVSSRRSASPMVSRIMTTTAMTPAPQNFVRRAQSAERRRPGTPRPSSEEMSTAAKLLVTSKRSLSVSFQGESFAMAVGKAKPVPSPSPAPACAQSVNGLSTARKGTPESRKPTSVRDRMVNSSLKVSDQQRWPGRSKPGNSSFLTRSLDYGAASEQARFNGSLSAVKTMQKSTIDVNNRLKTETRFEPHNKDVELEEKVEDVANGNSTSSNAAAADAAPSESESVSSWSNAGLQKCGYVAQSGGVPRGIIVPARFWQETRNRLRRVPEPGSPVSKNNGSKIMNVSKVTGAKKNNNDSPVSSPRIVSSNRGISSPIRGGTRPSSPNKCLNSSINYAVRGMPSPTRVRNGVASMLSNDVCSTPSILSFAADMRRVKMGENRIEDAHQLRLLYNRQLQSLFVNARAETAQLAQTETAERSLYNAWVTTSKLRHSVKSKRLELQLLSQNLRLFAILNEQVPYLDNWDMMERDYCTALAGAIGALESSIVRLPVVGGARADIQDVKNAVYSAIDVMQGMASSICILLPKVEQVNVWISELACLVASERALVVQSKDMLSKLTEMEVKDCSLRAHILQLRCLRPVLTTN
ncbi:hypothetical protein ACH5RR_027104 [Cinchona calisaya]|uniref:QWRF motif-containing protein 2 n=1 Tax=Cinchona calisaya TaxID=153742 RepID=A0ABD2Z7Q3_9GENT